TGKNRSQREDRDDFGRLDPRRRRVRLQVVRRAGHVVRGHCAGHPRGCAAGRGGDQRLAESGPGETTITWTTGNGAEGRVRVSTDGGLERTVTQGPAGTLPVNWINGSAV